MSISPVFLVRNFFYLILYLFPSNENKIIKNFDSVFYSLWPSAHILGVNMSISPVFLVW